MFSQDCQDCHMTFIRVSQNFCIVIHQTFRATGSRHSHDNLVKYFGKKIRINFLNMLKTFATSLRPMKILTTFVGHSHECHAKVHD